MDVEYQSYDIDKKHMDATEAMGSNEGLVGKFKNKKFSLQYETCTCKGENTAGAKKILPIAQNTKPIIVYNSCNRTLLAACKRQLRKQPNFDSQMMGVGFGSLGNKNGVLDFHSFCDKIFKDEIQEHLDDFDYNLEEWMNHLEKKKQDEVLPYYNDISIIKEQDMTEYTMFCKREKQIIDGKLPKNRAISCPHNSKKFVCGPVIWALEDVFAKKFKGYCGGKNWDELEGLFEQYYKEGYVNTLQGDGSAFDSTQTHDLKYIDRLITNYLIKNNKIKHVDPSLYEAAMNAQLKHITLKYRTNGFMKTLGDVYVDGTVFSGDPDTTFGNTLRMALYIRYTMYLAGYKEEDFKLLCKGDDFVVFVRDIKNQSMLNHTFNRSNYILEKDDPHYHIKSAFYNVFHPSDTSFQEDRVGLGMVLKFLTVGDYEDIDFCSTNVIHLNKHTGLDKFKIIRRIDRMTPLNHWSTKALSFSNLELKQYYLDLAMSMKCWAVNLPYFSEYIKALEYHASKVDTSKCKPNKSKKVNKQRFETSGKGKTRGFVDLTHYSKYGRDFINGLELRQSKLTPEPNEVYDFLLKKYQLSLVDLYDFERQLKTTLWVDPYQA